jgi:hypothetical protein
MDADDLRDLAEVVLTPFAPDDTDEILHDELAAYAERESDLARRLDVTEKVRPDPEERARRDLAELKRDYAEGRLSEAEFERRLEQLLSDSRLSETEVYREVDRER